MAEPLRVASEQLRRTFERTARELDERHENCTIARVCGSTVGVLGSGIAIICGLAAGPMAVPAGALVASAFGGTGAFIASGAQVMNIVLDHSTLAEAQRRLDAFRMRYNDVLIDETIVGNNFPLQQAIEQFISVAGKGVSVVGGAVKIYGEYKQLVAETTQIPKETIIDTAKNKTIEYAKNATDIVPDNVTCESIKNMFCKAGETGAECTVSGEATCKTVEKALSEAPEAVAGTSRSLGTTIAIANAAVLAFSVYDLVCASVELYRIKRQGRGSRPGDLLREIAEALRSVENAILAQQAREGQATLREIRIERRALDEARRSAEEQNRRLEENIRRMEEMQRMLDEQYRALESGRNNQGPDLPTVARYFRPC